MAHAMAIAAQALDVVGLPAIIRPSFTLGGTGGGIAYNRSEFFEIVERGLDASPTTEVLIEESVLGWKEYEMEVVRDKADNCIIICSIENIDPMGVHTGDSITVAPALTLPTRNTRSCATPRSRCCARSASRPAAPTSSSPSIPDNGRLVVIEMNPRVSRSSALASKATGFPIAKIAAKLAVGYTLDELDNDITGGATPASFEPSIDYVVTKIPRFAFEKFPGAEPTLTTAMKSVGEVMAIGRTFQESLQKALRGLETGLTGLDEIEIPGLDCRAAADDRNAIRAAIGTPTPDRLRMVAQALRMGTSIEDVHDGCKIDPWFIAQIKAISTWKRASASTACPTTPRTCACSRPWASPTRAWRRSRASDAEGSRRTAQQSQRPPGLQAHRHLRRRVRLAHRLHVLDLRGRPSPARPARKRRSPTAGRWSSSAAARTASARASSSTIAAAMPPSRWRRLASSRSWSTATRRPSRPTTTPPTASISSR